MKDILRHIVSRGARVHVRNALAPLLWLTAVAMPTLLFFVWLFGPDSSLAPALVAVALILPLAALVGYFIFMVRDPDRLQSEEYRLEHHRLTLLVRKGENAPVVESEFVKDDLVEVSEPEDERFSS